MKKFFFFIFFLFGVLYTNAQVSAGTPKDPVDKSEKASFAVEKTSTKAEQEPKPAKEAEPKPTKAEATKNEPW